jgi:hypothetical protein
MNDGGKGSRPRPFSVSYSTYSDNYETIFGKKDKMTPKVETMKTGSCGCGRSPTGDCVGWHGLSEEQYRVKLAEYSERVGSKNNLKDN